MSGPTQQVQRRRGTTAEHATFTGALGETTIDTDKHTVVVHDGVTPGGFPLALEGSSGASPLTTKGDIYTHSTVDARLPVGTNTQLLQADSTQTTGLKWTDVSALPDQTAYLRTDGTRALTGNQSAGTHKITNLGTPTGSLDATNKNYVDTGDAGTLASANAHSDANDATTLASAEAYTDTAVAAYLKKDGSVAMTGALDLGTHLIHNVVNPASAQDAATKASQDAGDAASVATAEAYADAADTLTLALVVKRDGTNNMTGALDLNSHLINNVTDPVSAQDAATKNYADTGDALAIPKSLLTTKGDIITRSSVPVRHGIGANGTVMVASSLSADGWINGTHSDLGNLTADDHTQYLRTDGTRALTGDQSAGSHKITNLATPTVSTDATTKAYVDAGDTQTVGGDLTGSLPNPTIAALAVTDAKVAAANKDGASGTPSMRTLGTGAAQACAGNDSRLSDSRAPTGSAGGDLTGTYPNPTLAVDRIAKNILTTKGDLITATAAATPVRHGRGTDGSVLVASAAAADGWINGTHSDLANLSADDHTQYIRVDGTRAFTGDQSLGSHKLTNVTDPASAQDAATKNYVDTADNLRLKLDGTAAMTGALNMNTHQINNVTDPTSAQDAATKAYADSTHVPVLPTIASVGAEFHSTGVPTATLPGTHAANDILLLILQTGNDSQVAAPSGYTQLGPQNGIGAAAAAGSTKLCIFWKRDNGSESAPTLVDTGDHTYGVMLAIRGCPTTGTPIVLGSQNWKFTASTSAGTIRSATWVDNTLVLDVFAHASDIAVGQASAETNANLTSVTEQFDGSTTDGNGGGIVVVSGVAATAGPVGPTTLTWDNSTVDISSRLHCIPATNANRDTFSPRPADVQIFIGSPADLDDTWVRPSGAKRTFAQICDGGSSGSAGRNAATAAGGGGGGGGGYDEAWYDPNDIGVSCTVHAGKGGAKTADTDGAGGNAGVVSEFNKGATGPLTASQRIAGTAPVGAVSADGGDGGGGSGRGTTAMGTNTTRADMNILPASGQIPAGNGNGGRGGSGTTSPVGGSPADWGGGGGESGADTDAAITSANNGWSNRGGGGGAGGRSTTGVASGSGRGGGAAAQGALAGSTGNDSSTLPYGGSGGGPGASNAAAGAGGFPGGGGGGGGTQTSNQHGGAGGHGCVVVTTYF